MKSRSDALLKFDEILKDKTSGSTDLLLRLNKLLIENINDDIKFRHIISGAESRLSHFQIIKHYLARLHKMIPRGTDELKTFLKETEVSAGSIENIYKRARPSIKNISSILTLSYSRTAAEFLKLWKTDLPDLKVTVCESRPKYEGRKLASELSKAGIRTELITDACMGLFIPECGAVLIGADSILKTGNVINKTGSLCAAVLCRQSGIPFFVVARSEKKSKASAFRQKEESPGEVWSVRHKNLRVRNFYFEEIDKKYISKIFS